MKLDDLTTDELVARFALLSEQQYPLMLNDDVTKFNRLFDKQTEIDRELRKRGIEARLELTKLFTHPNIQVRRVPLNAASESRANPPWLSFGRSPKRISGLFACAPA
jgi:hypothetical protein